MLVTARFVDPLLYPWLAADVNCRLPYADSVALEQPAHPRSLIWELHCQLICRKGYHWLISGQCSSQVRLRRCAGWSGATLSAYGRRQMAWAASQGLTSLNSPILHLDKGYKGEFDLSGDSLAWWPAYAYTQANKELHCQYMYKCPILPHHILKKIHF